MLSTEQQFLNDLEKKLWTAADRLRSNLDAALYMHVVLGLTFLKYISDAFEERQQELREQFSAPNHDYFLNPADFGGVDSKEYLESIDAELEDRDYYIEKNVFWVPVEARWQTLRDCAQLPPKAPLPWKKPGKDEPEEMRSVGWLIDNAMEAIKRENPRLKNVLNKDFVRVQLEPCKLAGLISHFSDTDFSAREYKGKPLDLKSKDILGHVYECLLGQFALAEGKKGGQYYTPKSIVTLIVEMLQPFKGRVYDPAMGSGGFFVQSEEFIEQHGGKAANGHSGQISVYGQESNPTTWKLAAMNMAIRGIDFNFGGGPADTMLNDLHPDLRADFVMANPPFNMKEWWNEKLANDPRWIAGTPPEGNANFAWLQHMLHHLAPTGSMALLLANGSMSSNTNNEGEIRKKLVEDDFVECMVALPGQLFTNTQIPACIWFLTRDKQGGFSLDKKKRDRRGEFLFIDARQLGFMKDRVLRDFAPEDIQKIADTFHAWQHGEGYEDEPGFCYSASLDDVQKHEHVLMPRRYVGAPKRFADIIAKIKARIMPASSQSTKDETSWNLVPLTPEYSEKEHSVYITAITEALQNSKIRNIALSGNYGVGKSSILQKVVEQYHKRVVELSLSTLAPIEESSLDASIPRQATTPTNRIQQEIVKQLLYREKPYNTPDSRFQRIERFRWLQESIIACIIGFIITVVFLLTSWTDQIATEFTSLIDFGLWVHLIVLIVAVFTVILMRHMFYGRIHIRQLSAGSATVTLDEKSVSYFDQYLDEIVYFFEISKRNVVIFEDIDRFNDSFIFETLRSLNALLNSSPQIKEPVRFIYAIKDSVFDQISLEQSKRFVQQECLNLEDPAQMEMVRANRTKFFDLIIPVVPFITHRNARDLVVQVLQKIKHDIDEELIDIASRYVPDMRLLKNVRNEFIVFRDRILTGEGQKLKLNDSELFAMMLYKSTHMLDFEAIRTGESKLDKIYMKSREIVIENMQDVEKEVRSVRNRLNQLDGLSELSLMLGEKLVEHMDRTLRAGGCSLEGGSLSLDHITKTVGELKTLDFWGKFVQASEDPVLVWRNSYSCQYRHNHYRQHGSRCHPEEFRFKRSELETVLNVRLEKGRWNKEYSIELKNKLERKLKALTFLRSADMSELIRSEGFSSEDNGLSKNLKTIACELLTEGLAYQLIRAGYINRNFTLYTSVFHGERVSTAATNFIIHHVERNVMDERFKLEDPDVEAVIRECGMKNLGEPSFYNVSILDYVLRANDAAAYLMVNSLAALNHNEKRFLQVYLTNIKELKKFVESFVPATSNALKYFASQVELEDPVRVELISCAFEHLADDVEYQIDVVTKRYLEENYTKFPVLTSNSLDDSIVDKISKVFLDAEIRVPALEPLSPIVRRAFISKDLYEINLENLKAVIGRDKSLALDNIYRQNKGVYGYVVKNLGAYLTAVRDVFVTVDSSDLFVSIIEDVLCNDRGHLNEIVSCTSNDCFVSKLNDVSKGAWPVLALYGRFPASFDNVNSYVELFGEVDSSLAKVLSSAGMLIEHESANENDKVRLAKMIIGSREHLPSQSRAELVESLNLSVRLHVEDVPAEKGKLFGLLVEKKIVEDNAETYAYLSSTDWPTREHVIQASECFNEYITPELLKGDLIAFLQSNRIAEDSKGLIVGRADEFFKGSDKKELTCLARFAIKSQSNIPFEVVEKLAVHNAPVHDVVVLLEPYLHKISSDQLCGLLQTLGSEYAALASLGKDRPKIPNTSSNQAILERLKQFNIVSGYSINGEILRVSKRHK